MYELRDYQIIGAKFLARNKRAILADVMGIGKTAQALRAIEELPHIVDSILIVCRPTSSGVWLREMAKWFQSYLDEYHFEILNLKGSPQQRQSILEDIERHRAQPHVVIVTYDILRAHKGFFAKRYFDVIIADEAHRIRNRKTQIFKAVKRLDSQYFFALTGTPSSRGAQDIWTLLNIIAPRVFSSFWRFVNAFCFVNDTDYGKEIYGTRNVENLQELLKRYFLRRTKAEVVAELPPKTRQLLDVEMESVQARAYKEMQENMIVALESTIAVAPTILTVLLRLRQLLVTPKLLDSNIKDYGGAFKALKDHIEDAEDAHCVVFTPFAKAIPFLEEYFFDYETVSFQGGMSQNQLESSLEDFKTHRKLAFCTIKYAQGFSFSSASRAYFLQYEWTPDENYQAEDRLHRLDTINSVNIYYIFHKGTVDEHLLALLDEKQRNVANVTDDKKRLLALIKGNSNEYRRT